VLQKENFMLTQQSPAREYLEIRHAQLDVLFAQVVLINSRIRLLRPRDGALLRKKLSMFRRQCQSAKKILLTAEHDGMEDLDRTRQLLDQSCDQLNRLSAELRYQVGSTERVTADTIQIPLSGLPHLKSAALNPQPAENEIVHIQ